MAEISSKAQVHPTARLAIGVVIMENAWIGPNVTIDSGTVVEQNAIVGYHSNESTAQVHIGRECLIANNATIYHSVSIGDGVKVRHNVVLREGVEVGDGTSVGTGCSVECHTRIGRFCSIHSGAHITDFSLIGDFVFIGPGFVSLSDLHLDYQRPQLHKAYKGVTIGRAARIGGGVLALPGCEVGEETVVGAGSQINGVLKSRTVYLGVPARAIRRVPPEEEIQWHL
jgi:acetyltransferase-like isoleucine patch superfamily enzyme